MCQLDWLGRGIRAIAIAMQLKFNNGNRIAGQSNLAAKRAAPLLPRRELERVDDERRG